MSLSAISPSNHLLALLLTLAVLKGATVLATQSSQLIKSLHALPGL